MLQALLTETLDFEAEAVVVMVPEDQIIHNQIPWTGYEGII